jgi:hypothetical protein
LRIGKNWREESFETYLPKDGMTFEREWPQLFDILLLDQTIRWSKSLRPLTKDCEN